MQSNMHRLRNGGAISSTQLPELHLHQSPGCCSYWFSNTRKGLAACAVLLLLPTIWVAACTQALVGGQPKQHNGARASACRDDQGLSISGLSRHVHVPGSHRSNLFNASSIVPFMYGTRPPSTTVPKG